MHYDELSDAEKLELRKRAQKATLVDVWGSLTSTHAANWSPRAQIAAEMLHGASSVADIGCGLMTLENYLPSDVRYVPVDCVSRDDRTIVVDLNREKLPDTNTDAAAALGLMEYLFDVQAFIKRLSAYSVSVVTYHLSDFEEPIERPTMWVNAFSRTEMETMFSDAGLSIHESRQFGAQTLWRLERSIGGDFD